MVDVEVFLLYSTHPFTHPQCSQFDFFRHFTLSQKYTQPPELLGFAREEGGMKRTRVDLSLG